MKSAVLHFEESRSLLKYDLDVEELVNCRVHTYEAGECILQQGLAVDALFVILEGTARVCISAENGRSLILCSYVSSGILGDIELMLDEKTAATTVIAVSEFSCIAIPVSRNREALKSNIRFINHIGRELSLKLLSRSDAHMASALLSSEERLCSYILATEHNGVFREYLTDAAQSIGVSYRHVFRIIRRLCEAGILEKTGTGLRILDRGQLQKKSGAREHCFFI